MLTASLNQEWMYRGGDFTLIVQILTEASNEPYVIPPEGSVNLRLAQTSAQGNSVLDTEADAYYRDEGIVNFRFTAEDTRDLLAISYDLTIHVTDGNSVFPVFTGRFALREFNPPAVEPTNRRTVEHLLRRVREELRAEGPDGAGYSDFIIMDAINSALDDLSGVFTIRDEVIFTTEENVNTYDLRDITPIEVVDIIRIDYDGVKIGGKHLDKHIESSVVTDGAVKDWLLWGNKLTLHGKVGSGSTVKLWITRPPKRIRDKDSLPETPSYADEAIIAYAVSVCYRESKDYDRANFHYAIYMGQKNDLLKRAVPQMQKDQLSVMRCSYAKPFRSRRGFIRTDTNPNGVYK